MKAFTFFVPQKTDPVTIICESVNLEVRNVTAFSTSEALESEIALRLLPVIPIILTGFSVFAMTWQNCRIK
jgi:hypothetical protein